MAIMSSSRASSSGPDFAETIRFPVDVRRSAPESEDGMGGGGGGAIGGGGGGGGPGATRAGAIGAGATGAGATSEGGDVPLRAAPGTGLSCTPAKGPGLDLVGGEEDFLDEDDLGGETLLETDGAATGTGAGDGAFGAGGWLLMALLMILLWKGAGGGATGSAPDPDAC